MSALNEEQARAYMHKLLAAMSQQGGSDLFIAHDYPPSMKAHGTMQPLASQKLTGKGRKAAIEILINTPTIAERIFKGEFGELKAIMAKSRELGMRTFDWALFELYSDNHISYEEAIRNADSANELRLAIKLKSPRGEPSNASGTSLSMEAKSEPPAAEEKK